MSKLSQPDGLCHVMTEREERHQEAVTLATEGEKLPLDYWLVSGSKAGNMISAIALLVLSIHTHTDRQTDNDGYELRWKDDHDVRIAYHLS